MKVNIEYEFKAKIKSEVDLSDVCERLSYDEFARAYNDVIDDSVRQFLANEFADHNKDMVTVERIGINFDW